MVFQEITLNIHKSKIIFNHVFYFICELIYNNTSTCTVIRYKCHLKISYYIAYSLHQHHIIKIFFVYKQNNDRVTPQRPPYYFRVIESYPAIVLPTLTGLPHVTLVPVDGTIFTRSSNLALRVVTLEVVGGIP